MVETEGSGICMTEMNYFTFDGIDSRDYSVYVYPLNIDSAPQREYTEVVIAGRQGTLTLDNKRNENVVHSYQGIIFSETAEEDLADFRSAIASVVGVKKLSDSINSSRSILAICYDIITQINQLTLNLRNLTPLIALLE